MFFIYLRTNSDLCHLHHKLIGFYNRDEKCLLRGTNWVFKKSSLRFVFKGLIFCSECKQRVKRVVCIRSRKHSCCISYHEGMLLFSRCVQGCVKHTFNIKFISAMNLMFIACCKGFIRCSKPVVGNVHVFNDVALHEVIHCSSVSSCYVLM